MSAALLPVVRGALETVSLLHLFAKANDATSRKALRHIAAAQASLGKALAEISKK